MHIHELVHALDEAEYKTTINTTLESLQKQLAEALEHVFVLEVMPQGSWETSIMQQLPHTLQHYQRFDSGLPIFYYVFKYPLSSLQVYVGARGASTGRANLLNMQKLLQDKDLAKKLIHLQTNYEELANCSKWTEYSKTL